MAMKTVTPEIIGRVRGAQRNVRYIPTNEGRSLQEAGRAVSGMVKMAAKGLDFMADLADERHRASYAKALTEAEAEAGKRFAEEVKQRVGFDAQGAAQLTQQIYSEVGAKYRSQVAERYQDQFDLNWTRHSGGQFRNATDFEFRNVRQATITATRQRMDSARDRQDWEEMESAYNEQYRLINGGRAITSESLETFDRDIAEGKGVLTHDGKRLRVTEKDEGEGTISKERVAKVRAALETRVAAYNKGLTDLYDVSHARAVDAYLSQEDVTGAREYLMSIKEAGIPVSEKTYSSMEKTVARHEEVQEVKVESERIVADTIAEAENPRYNSVEQEAAFFERLNKAPDKVKRAALQRWRETKATRDANFQLDLYNFSKEKLQTVDKNGKPVALPLSKQEEAIRGVEDPTLREALLKIHKKKVIAEENELNAKPEYIAYAESALSQFTRDIGRGYAETDGKKVKLATQEQMMMHLRSLGLTSKYQKKAVEYIRDSANMVGAAEVEGVLRRVFKDSDLTAEDIRKYVPFIQHAVEDRRGTLPLGGKTDRSKWIKEQVEDVLTQKFEEKGGMIYDTNYELKEAIEEGVEPGNLYMDKANFDAFQRKQNQVWWLRGANRGGSKRHGQLKAQGLYTEDEEGRYFIRKGNY